MKARPVRLVARTLGSHPSNRGSIPLRATRFHPNKIGIATDRKKHVKTILLTKTESG